MSNDKKNYLCDFCGKTRNDVAKLIVGNSASICNECIDLCGNILEEEKIKTLKETGDDIDWSLLGPTAIKAVLDQHVIGQEDAKISLSVAVSQHYKKIKNPSKDIKLDKTNVMVMGPT